MRDIVYGAYPQLGSFRQAPNLRRTITTYCSVQNILFVGSLNSAGKSAQSTPVAFPDTKLSIEMPTDCISPPLKLAEVASHRLQEGIGVRRSGVFDRPQFGEVKRAVKLSALGGLQRRPFAKQPS